MAAAAAVKQHKAEFETSNTKQSSRSMATIVRTLNAQHLKDMYRLQTALNSELGGGGGARGFGRELAADTPYTEAMSWPW